MQWNKSCYKRSVVLRVSQLWCLHAAIHCSIVTHKGRKPQPWALGFTSRAELWGKAWRPRTNAPPSASGCRNASWSAMPPPMENPTKTYKSYRQMMTKLWQVLFKHVISKALKHLMARPPMTIRCGGMPAACTFTKSETFQLLTRKISKLFYRTEVEVSQIHDFFIHEVREQIWKKEKQLWKKRKNNSNQLIFSPHLLHELHQSIHGTFDGVRFFRCTGR